VVEQGRAPLLLTFALLCRGSCASAGLASKPHWQRKRGAASLPHLSALTGLAVETRPLRRRRTSAGDLRGRWACGADVYLSHCGSCAARCCCLLPPSGDFYYLFFLLYRNTCPATGCVRRLPPGAVAGMDGLLACGGRRYGGLSGGQRALVAYRAARVRAACGWTGFMLSHLTCLQDVWPSVNASTISCAWRTLARGEPARAPPPTFKNAPSVGGALTTMRLRAVAWRGVALYPGVGGRQRRWR